MDERIINKIEGLLRKADPSRGATEAEAAAAAQKAQALALKHGIELDALNPDGQTSSNMLGRDGLDGRWQKWERTLLHIVSSNLGCRIVWSPIRASIGVVHLYGPSESRQAALSIYQHIKSWVDMNYHQAVATRLDPTIPAKTYGHSWRLGAMRRFKARLEERYKETEREVGTSLVPHKVALDKLVGEHHPALRAGPGSRISDPNAYAQGYNDAGSASMGGDRISGTRGVLNR